MPVSDVYLLALHEPYETPECPVPINGTIVHALTLLHRQVRQPDGGRMYRCLTEFPNRTSGSVVPLSTLTYELGGGALWGEIADWERVVDELVTLVRNKSCDAMPLGLPGAERTLLAQGPFTQVHLHLPDGSEQVVGHRERHEQIYRLSEYLHRILQDGPFWPGDNLDRPPKRPRRMPYRPYKS